MRPLGTGKSAGDLLEKPRRRHPVRRFFFRLLLFVILYFLIVPPYILPVKGRITSGYLFRPAPDQVILPSMEIHGGIDIAAARGTAVLASKGGRIVSAGTDRISGNHVEISHWLGFSTRYAHLDSLSVRQGSRVMKGGKIGTVGATGRATGPHLHFEIRWRGHRMPPGLMLFFGSLRAMLLSLVFGPAKG